MHGSSFALVVWATIVVGCSSHGSTSPTALGTPTSHRATATDCTANPAVTKTCTSAADCSMIAGAFCGPSGFCIYDQCVRDADCGAGEVCSCKGATRGWAGASNGNVCVKGNCRVDADCGAGSWCSPSFGDCGSFYGVQSYECHTASDDCHSDTDCGATPDAGGNQPYCGYDAVAGKWTCMSHFCAG